MTLPTVFTLLAGVAACTFANPRPVMAAGCDEPTGTPGISDSTGTVDGVVDCDDDGRPGNPYPRLRLWCGPNAVRYVENWGADVTDTGIEVNGEVIFGPTTAGVYQNGRWGDYTLHPGVRYTALVVTCIFADGATSDRYIIYGGTPAVDPIALRDRARARITIGDPPARTNPPFDDPNRFGIVQIPTWLWLDGAYWTARTEGETEGGVAVTVTATPLVARWNPGDGTGEVRCPDAGAAWSPGLADGATSCTHTYRSSSADQPGTRYRLQVAVDWQFTWTLNGVDQGAFGTISPATDLTYQVGEIQAVES